MRKFKLHRLHMENRSGGVTTQCGIYGERVPGSADMIETDSGRVYELAPDRARVTCTRCLSVLKNRER